MLGGFVCFCFTSEYVYALFPMLFFHVAGSFVAFVLYFNMIFSLGQGPPLLFRTLYSYCISYIVCSLGNVGLLQKVLNE